MRSTKKYVFLYLNAYFTPQSLVSNLPLFIAMHWDVKPWKPYLLHISFRDNLLGWRQFVNVLPFCANTVYVHVHELKI